jgi:ribonuclease HI
LGAITIYEYEACILVLEVALELNIRKIDMYGDSILISERKMANQGREVETLPRITV